MNKKIIITFIAVLFLTALFIKNAELTSKCVKNGLDICFTTIIPSLFPLMVVSETLCECGTLDFLGKLIDKKLPKLFGLSQKGLAAVIMGLVLGFPIGTRALIKLYDSGEISKGELESAIGFCGIPSFGFIVNIMGTSIFSSKNFGVFMYICAIISALISGLIFSNKANPTMQNFHMVSKKEKSPAGLFTAAVSSASQATVTLCAYVVFFACALGCISQIFTNKKATALIGVFSEISYGILRSSEVGRTASAILCGFAIGWSGLSVHCQTAALLSSRAESYLRYFVQKLFQALFCALAAFIGSRHFELSSASIGAFAQFSFFSVNTAVAILTAVCLFTVRKRKTPNAKR